MTMKCSHNSGSLISNHGKANVIVQKITVIVTLNDMVNFVKYN